jgi:putative Mg2+ transporter-C (MgtC) family protein
MVNWINRLPISARMTEALYCVHVVCDPTAVSDVRDLLDAELEVAKYPIREIETLANTSDHVELAAVLLPTSADPAELDAVVLALKRSHLVQSATWSAGATH